MSARLRAGRRKIQISSPDKVLFARARLTKLELARYYADVAGAMVPHVRDRPVTMFSCPGGVEAECHIAKAAPAHFPDWIRRATVPKRGGQVTHVLANDAATLAYLAGQNVITPHVWLSRVDRPLLPDRLIFVDVMRNAYAQHAVAPYGVRPLSEAPVATPLHWEELDDRRLGPRRYTVGNLAQRLAAEGDPWAGIVRSARSIPAGVSAGAR